MTLSNITALSSFTDNAPGSPAYMNAKFGEVNANLQRIAAVGQSSVSSLGWYNVKDYGATGDGATDDTTAILAALSAVPQSVTNAQGGYVYFPTGNYLISSVLTISQRGVKVGGVVGGQTTRGEAVLTAASGLVGGTMVRINVPAGDKGAHLERLKLDGASRASVALEIATGSLRPVTVRDLTIVNVTSGISTGYNCESGVFEKITAFSGISRALSMGTDNRHMTFRDCVFGGTNRAVVIGGDTSTDGDRCTLPSFVDCEFYAISDSTAGAVWVRNTHAAYFQGCWAEVETSNASDNIQNVVEFGSTSGVATNPFWIGGRVVSNDNAHHGIELVNTTRPIIVGPVIVSSNSASIGNGQGGTLGIILGVPSINSLNGLNLWSSDASTLGRAFSFTSDPRVGFHWSGASTVAMSAGTLDLSNAQVRMSSTSSLIGAFVVQGSASSFTVVTWAAAKANDIIMVTPTSLNAAVSSLSSGIVAHSHCTQNGQVELRLSNCSTLAQNVSSKTWYFTRITPF